MEELIRDRVLICDESHYGTAVSKGDEGRISRICDMISSPLWYDKKRMEDNNTYVLLISATPFAELVKIY